MITSPSFFFSNEWRICLVRVSNSLTETSHSRQNHSMVAQLVRFAVLPFLFILPLNVRAEFIGARNNFCKVYLKPTQQRMGVFWHGPCQKGFADGLGVARYVRGKTVDSVFYGTMKMGYWDLGVYDFNGYQAGQFKNNEVINGAKNKSSNDQAALVQAFKIAAKAAEQLSQDYQKQGNKASALHYKSESEKLSQQIK